MEAQAIQTHLTAVILTRLADTDARRREALQEFMGVTMPAVDNKTTEHVAGMVPEIPMPVYNKWVTLFAERMLETVQHDQLAELCDNTEENNATIALIYIMFMESERMEKQIASDLHTLGIELADSDPEGNTLGAYLRNRLAIQKDATPE